MDALFICATMPVVLSAQAALLPGAWLPLPVPVAALPLPVRAQWARQAPVASRALRVEWLLQANAERDAWALLIQCPGPLAGEVGLEAAAMAWGERWLAEHAVPAQRSGTLVFRAGAWVLADGDWAGGVADGLAVLAVLPGPRWLGPLLMVAGQAGPAVLPAGSDAIIRPVAPVVRLATEASGDALRGEVAARVAVLHLDLWAPPATGWPMWLRLGVAGVARAKGRGEGPSPRDMAERRAQAGAQALNDLVLAHDGSEVDAALATAACTPLVSVRHAARLPVLLAALRQGLGGREAVAVAYGWDVQRWLTER